MVVRKNLGECKLVKKNEVRRLRGKSKVIWIIKGV
jgi:hypothetical protein